MTSRDTAKGRVKKAAGDLTGDKELRREGAVDEAAGKAKSAVDAAADGADDAAGGAVAAELQADATRASAAQATYIRFRTLTPPR